MGFTEETIQKVWNKGSSIQGSDPVDYRADYQGNFIVRSKYGVSRDIDGQWEIDHVIRESEGGSDEVSNLRPLSGKANAKRG